MLTRVLGLGVLPWLGAGCGDGPVELPQSGFVQADDPGGSIAEAGGESGDANQTTGGKPFVVMRTDVGGKRGWTSASFDGGYFCRNAADCWNQCPTPQEPGGTTVCHCVDQGGVYSCTITRYDPGEEVLIGGGGNGEEDRCGDARDGLTAEYVERGVWGDWPCTKFNKRYPELIGVGSAGYHAHHEGYGFVSSALPRGIAKVESHFGIRLAYTSGYRCPARNALLPRPAGAGDPDKSHHVFGQAVDFVTASTPWTPELKQLIHEWGLDPANAAESINYPSEDGNHNHLAWR